MSKIVIYAPKNGGKEAKIKSLVYQGVEILTFVIRPYIDIWSYPYIWAYEKWKYHNPWIQ